MNKLVIRSSLKILALKFEYFDVSFITELFFIRRLIKSKNDHDLQTFLNIYTSILQQIKQFWINPPPPPKDLYLSVRLSVYLSWLLKAQEIILFATETLRILNLNEEIYACRTKRAFILHNLFLKSSFDNSIYNVESKS